MSTHIAVGSPCVSVRSGVGPPRCLLTIEYRNERESALCWLWLFHTTLTLRSRTKVSSAWPSLAAAMQNSLMFTSSVICYKELIEKEESSRRNHKTKHGNMNLGWRPVEPFERTGASARPAVETSSPSCCVLWALSPPPICYYLSGWAACSLRVLRRQRQD